MFKAVGFRVEGSSLCFFGIAGEGLGPRKTGEGFKYFRW